MSQRYSGQNPQVSQLEMTEVDGSPDVKNVNKIVVSNGTLTDDGGGQVTLTTGGGGGAIIHSPQTRLCGRVTFCFLFLHKHAGHVVVSRVAAPSTSCTGITLPASNCSGSGNGTGAPVLRTSGLCRQPRVADGPMDRSRWLAPRSPHWDCSSARRTPVVVQLRRAGSLRWALICSLQAIDPWGAAVEPVSGCGR